MGIHARHVLAWAVATVEILAYAPPSLAVTFAQGPKLVGSDAAGTGYQGLSVAISADGDTALVGAPAGQGAAWVFVRTAGIWSQQGARLFPSDADGGARVGAAVAVSADGNTALIGGPGQNGNEGAAWVYVRSGGTWQQGPKLLGAGASGTASFGQSVAISADGSTAVIGGPTDNSQEGAAWVFTRSGSSWNPQGGKLVASDASAVAFQGGSAALSADGSAAIIGAELDTQSTGAAFVFTRSGSTWTEQQKLVGTGAGPMTQGRSVALSADGNTASVGGPGGNAAWVFTRSGSTWTQQGAALTVPDNVHLGQSVALSADGNTLLAGGPFADALLGAVWVFARSGGSWMPAPQPKLVGPGAVAAPSVKQGVSVALSASGATAIAGGFEDDSIKGAAWIFMGCPRGDATGNGALDVADVFHLINSLFAGGPAPASCF